MINENILDDNLESIDKPFVRTERIQQIETLAIVGAMASIALNGWSMISLIKYIVEFGLTSIILLFGFATNLAVLVAFGWWRKVSIEYDANAAIQRIELPAFLTIARIWIPIYGAWVLLTSFFSISIWFSYITGGSGMPGVDIVSFTLRMFFGIGLAVLYIYYWRITKQSMDFVNK